MYYARDFTIILQESWYHAYHQGLKEQFGFESPFTPPIIYHIQEGLFDVWENPEGIQWVHDQFLKKAKADPEFLPDLLQRYRALVKPLSKIWKKGRVETKSEFQAFINQSIEAATLFLGFYYLGMDDRTPKNLRELALKERETDVFFDSYDDVLQGSLAHLFPELGQLKTMLSRAEVVGSLPSRSVLEARYHSAILIPGKLLQPMSLEDFLKGHPEYEFQRETAKFDGRTLKGQSAQRGKVKGRARVIRRFSEAPLLKPGEILVASMTTPRFIEAMHKAAAFVTDEGGITCHAAIVAREMKKPCVIGTKIATKILKDGDVVEVDADKGIVRIVR